jgi:hypothetical protein
MRKTGLAPPAQLVVGTNSFFDVTLKVLTAGCAQQGRPKKHPSVHQKTYSEKAALSARSQAPRGLSSFYAPDNLLLENFIIRRELSTLGQNPPQSRSFFFVRTSTAWTLFRKKSVQCNKK